MVLNATFNNISVISWRSVLLMEETGVPGENHWPAATHWQTLSHIVVSSTPRLEGDRHDVIGSYKSNHHTITTTTDPKRKNELLKLFFIVDKDITLLICSLIY